MYTVLQPNPRIPLPSVRGNQLINAETTQLIFHLRVAYAKQKHYSLFEKIAAEHARLGEEQLAQRLAFEATSIRNEEDSSYHHE